MIEFKCPKCRETMTVPGSFAGQPETCPSCGNVAVVPQPSSPPVQPVPVAPHPFVPQPAHITVNVMGPKATSGFGVAALVLGILACLTCWIPFVGILSIPLSALGILFGVVGFLVSAVGRRSGIGMPFAGLVVCVVAIAIAGGSTFGIFVPLDRAMHEADRNPAKTNPETVRAPSPSKQPLPTHPASPATQKTRAAPAPATASGAQGVDDLEIRLRAAQGEAEKALIAYAVAKDAKLNGDAQYQAARAKAAEMTQKVEKARATGSPDLPSISMEWMNAQSESRSAEAAALNSPALRALGDEVIRTQTVLDNVQGKIAERNRRAADAAKVVVAEKNRKAAAAAAAERASRPITYEQFLQIKEGMSYAEVYRILGRDGRELSRVSLGGITTVMLSWENPGFSNMNVTFQDGEVVAKAQLGLK